MKYQNNQTRIITVRVEMRKTKNGVVWIIETKAENFAMHNEFRYHSENSGIAKIPIFAMHSTFRYDSENSL